jgi:hypothetical protein
MEQINYYINKSRIEDLLLYTISGHKVAVTSVAATSLISTSSVSLLYIVSIANVKLLWRHEDSGRGGIVLLIQNLDTNWRLVVTLTPRAL